MQSLSSKGDTGISGWVNQNSNLIINEIVQNHPITEFLREEGYPVKKSIFTRSEMLLFFENPSSLDPEILRRTNNRTSTDKLLAEIFTSQFPNAKLSLKDKKQNTATSISIQFTAKSVGIINKILHSKTFKRKIDSMRENIFTFQTNPNNIKAHIMRAATCNVLSKLESFKEDTENYRQAINLDSSEKIMQQIWEKNYQEKSP